MGMETCLNGKCPNRLYREVKIANSGERPESTGKKEEEETR